MEVYYEGDNYTNIETYTLETYEAVDVSFDDTDGFIEFINTLSRAVFFERGWLEIEG